MLSAMKNVNDKTFSLILKNFLYEGESEILNEWTLNNLSESNHFHDAGMDPDNPNTRFTTRFPNESIAENINYPEIVFKIKDRIINYFHLKEYKSPPSYSHGIVNGIGLPGGRIEEHIDPTYYDNTFTLHCNILSMSPESGGDTIINGKTHKINEGDLLAYLVSEQYHEVTKTNGSIPRILWVFGFCIDNKKVKEMFL